MEMYAGDTTPWKIAMVRENGEPYITSSTSGYTCKLALTPFAVYAGIGNNAITQAPILTKTGVVKIDTNGQMYATITFSTTDTIALRGRYTYQVEVANGSDKRICQGQLVIRGNINR